MTGKKNPKCRATKRIKESAEDRRAYQQFNLPIAGAITVFDSCRLMIPCILPASLLLSVILHLAIPLSLPAQTFQGGVAQTLPSASAGSYYYIAKPGDLTMQVNVWGLVKNPGRYEVASSTNLIQLISYAGGPSEDARLSEVRIMRLVEKDSMVTPTEIVIQLDHADGLEVGASTLLPGDTVFIDRSRWSTLRDAFSVVTTVGIITTAIAQLLIAVGK